MRNRSVQITVGVCHGKTTTIVNKQERAVTENTLTQFTLTTNES